MSAHSRLRIALSIRVGIDSSKHERLLDFGCGQGATCRFFHSKGFDVYGVDISKPGIAACQVSLPEIRDHFTIIAPKLQPNRDYFGMQFKVVTASHSPYYLGDSDFRTLIESLHEQMEDGALVYATMIGERNKFTFFEHKR